MNPIIEVNNYTKKYGDFTAVDDVSFEVEEGSIFAFLGPNGAGKSTTINTLCTMMEKTSGTLLIDGRDVSTEKDAVREAIGVVFQSQTLDEKMTVNENLKMHCVFYGVPKHEVKERIDFVLNLVDLQEWQHKRVSSLSGGMKRRVEIARALLHYPKVLFLDEPTTGLDPQTRNRMWEYITRLQKEKNITIFLTTHYMDEAEICDHVAIMDNGKIMVDDTPENLKRLYTKDKAIVSVKNPRVFEEALKKENQTYKKEKDTFYIHIDAVQGFLQFIEQFKDELKDLEIKKGTLNDVFLEITGKEIREETAE
ncbi:MAG: ABC transporter ATP-binding protein [Alkalibacterium gilvum]|uniref:ABC-2 type transport system ATP-binding protein n=1 Tax=Alkalibacterium gilvum TaxID=1130080 RepID=A0A1H6S7V9_9LACT|nr:MULTISPECIES: ABC transporter ATP-binding protein [Alkalibacterium]MDN6293188.1 ABC transporter ATP-binding protein [Alkalibacterium sp.]MDN6294829.1 ABC transporter ATP-binding protein [Alkalibacterium sp.]MDN6397896.1 ABC transporter ATP-binding protein [Alkalibacterium sp.]SEI63979.1 ABC-2 type transport system ATP-binding protein [Alkalibacterium gilvum]HAJ69974.1 ABC transporter ATP-binding protein [Alkalibacterium sp.]